MRSEAVVDNEIKLEITEADILYGIPRCDGFCPIARALGHKFPGEDIHVNHTTATIGSFTAPLVVYNLPIEGVEFVVGFDAGRKCEPTTIVLTKVTSVVK
jgi:hypothetical protein